MVGEDCEKTRTLSVREQVTSAYLELRLNSSNTAFKLVIQESGVGPFDHTSFLFAETHSSIDYFFNGQARELSQTSYDAHKLNTRDAAESRK